MKNERGFTLMEMVISLGVIAIIGSLLVSSIVTINANTKTADLMSFLDGVTSEAREVFASNPDKVINNNFDSTDPSFFPYIDMAYQVKNANEVLYTQSYTENLHQTTIGNSDEQYKIEISLLGSDQSAAPGFSFKTKKIKMKAKVSEKVNGIFKPEPIYSKEYTFDNVIVSQFPTVGEAKKVTFQGNGGCIVQNTNQTACLGFTKEKDYFKGDSIYSPGVDGSPIYAAYLKNSLFIGWSLGSNDRNLLGNNYKVMNDMAVYAQYLSTNQYRLEFQISGDERFNVEGITGDAATKPYFVEKTSTAKPTISGMEPNISRFFVKNAVRKNGYRFDYWEDANGKKVDPSTVMDQQYMILYPHFTPLDSGDQEMLSLNLNLDLNNISAGKSNNVDRLFALYPFTKMEYSLKYNTSDDSFDITQKEIMNKDYQTLTGISKGSVMSTKTFNTKQDANFYLTLGGKKYTSFTEYVKASLDDPSHSFSIADVRLHVSMPTFSLGDYYTSPTAKDVLRANTGNTLDKNSATSLFSNPTASAVFSYANNQPLDAASLTAIDNKISDLTNNTGTFYNTGAVSFASSAATSYDSYKKKGKPTTTYIYDDHIKQYNIYITIPLSNLGKMLNKNKSDLAKKGGVHVSNVKAYYDDQFDAYKSIHIRYDLKFGDGSYAVDNPNGSPTVDINTGIPLIEDQYQKDPDGNELYTYNKISTINFTIDNWNGYNGSFDGLGKSEMSDFTLDSSDVQYVYIRANGTVADEDIAYKPGGAFGNTGWFPYAALSGGYQNNYGWMYNDPNFDKIKDIESKAWSMNRADQYNTRALQNQWDTSNTALGGYWDLKARPCGYAYWWNPFPSSTNGTWMTWQGPRQIPVACLINNKSGIPNNPGNGSNFSKQLSSNGNVSFKIPVVTPGVDVNVISFSKPGSTHNYLPSFIKNVPY